MLHEIKVIVKDNNIDLKTYLKKFHVGRSKIEEIRNSNMVFVNDEKVKLDYIVKFNDVLKIVSEEKEVPIYNKKIDILYEDSFFIAVYKNPRILVHSDGEDNKTLINAVAFYLENKKEDPIVYPLQRLDFKAQGIVIFAKNFLACSIFSFMMEKHLINKKYILLCQGKLKEKKGTISLYLGKDRHNSKKMVVLKHSDLLAVTKYEVLDEFNDSSLVQATILTGRKHQIRISFAYLNHPIIGDELYGNFSLQDNLKLKAVFLSFKHPFTLENVKISLNNSFEN